MRRPTAFIATIVAALVASPAARPSPPVPLVPLVPPMVPGTPAACWNPAASIALTGASCAPLRAPQISCFLPADVEGALQQPNDNTRQRATDLFAWQGFLALSWPAADGQRGVPDPAKRLEAPGLRTWETWK